MPGRKTSPSEGSSNSSEGDPPISIDEIKADLKDYTVISTLGSGGYGLIVEVKAKKDKSEQPQAVKAIPLGSFEKMGTTAKKFVNERLAKIEALDHTNIARALGHRKTDKAVYIFMEKVSQKTLVERINEASNQRVAESDAKELAKALCSVLDYCHDQAVIHRDLKPENIWWLKDDAAFGECLLGDFDAVTIGKKDGKRFRSEGLGTPGYMAPEIVKLGLCDAKVDEFALGCTLVEVLTGSPLLLGEEADELKDEVLNEDFEFDHDAWQNLSAESLDFVKRLVCKDPKKRMSASEALKHDWLAEKKRSASPNENERPAKTRRTRH